MNQGHVAIQTCIWGQNGSLLPTKLAVDADVRLRARRAGGVHTGPQPGRGCLKKLKLAACSLSLGVHWALGPGLNTLGKATLLAWNAAIAQSAIGRGWLGCGRGRAGQAPSISDGAM